MPLRRRNDAPSEATVVVHRAHSLSEAVVLRALLESAGIPSPALAGNDPYPLRRPPADFPGVEILVPESYAEEARDILEEYLSDADED